MKSIFAEIRSDYTDENGVTHLDGYKTEDEDEGGVTICFIVKGEVYWRDPDYQFDPMVKEVVAEVKKLHAEKLEELKKEIKEAVTSVVYNGDAKPRPEFTNGSPLEVKLSLINEGVEKIVKLL